MALQSLGPTPTKAGLCKCEEDMLEIINARHTHGTGMGDELNLSWLKFGIVVAIGDALRHFLPVSTRLLAPAAAVEACGFLLRKRSQVHIPLVQLVQACTPGAADCHSHTHTHTRKYRLQMCLISASFGATKRNLLEI